MTSSSRPSGDGDGSPDLRELMLDAGLEILRRDGFSLQSESITYHRVFEHLSTNYGVKVTRGSVHERIWANQEEYRFEVLLKAIRVLPRRSEVEPAQSTYRDLVGLGAQIEEARDLRTAGMSGAEMLRTWSLNVGSRIAELIIGSAELRVVQSMKAVVRATVDEESRRLLTEAAAERENETTRSRRPLLKALLAELEMRPKRALGLSMDDAIDIMETCNQALVAAAALDHEVGMHGMTDPLPYASADGPVWNRFTLGAWAMYRFLFEADDPEAAAERRREATAALEQRPLEGPNPIVGPALFRKRLGLRRTRAELQDLVLAAGVELILREGPALAPASLTYAAAFDEIEDRHGFRVNRSSIHRRFWDSQVDFRYEVLSRAILLDPHAFYDRMETQLREPDPTIDGTTVGRSADWVETLRRLALRADEVIDADPDFGRLQLVKAAVMANTGLSEVEPVRRTAAAAGSEMLSMFAKYSAALLPIQGFQPSSTLGIREAEAHHTFAELLVATATGLDFNRHAGFTAVDKTVELRGGPDQAAGEWNILGIATRAFLELLFECPGGGSAPTV